MTTLTIVLMSMTTLLGLTFFGLFCWAVKDGQLEDVEEAKYEIFREDEGEEHE